MRKLNPKVSETKPLRQLNKSTSSISSTQVSICTPSSKTIQSQTYIKPVFDKELIVSIVRDEILSLQYQVNQTNLHLHHVSQELKEEKENNLITLNLLKVQVSELLKRAAKEPEPVRFTDHPPPKTQNKDSSEIQSNIGLIFERLDILTQQNTWLKSKYHPNQIQTINKSIEEVQIELNGISRDLQKQIAELRDSFTEVNQTLDDHINTVGDKIRLFDIQKSINELTDKVNIFSVCSEKQHNEIQKIQSQIDIHQTLIEKYQYREMKLKDTLMGSMNETKESLQSQSRELEEFLCQRLGKMIESYNNNFEQMDRSIVELKDTIKEVLYLNKFISENIGQKLRNTIDNNTFNQTIANLNEKFSETHQLNYEKIIQLNTKEYEVENELSYMKTMLENLKMDFKHNYNTQKLGEDLSLESSHNYSLEQSKHRSIESKKKFMKPTFVFPERDSFNFNEERKRKSMGVDEVRGFVLKIDREN